MRIAALLMVVALLVCDGARRRSRRSSTGRARRSRSPTRSGRDVLESGGRAGGAIGYTADQMRDFGKDTHLLGRCRGCFATCARSRARRDASRTDCSTTRPSPAR